MPASYRGNLIFGLAVQMESAINPTADQANAFFGVSGIESLYGGQRGRVTMVKGLLGGSSGAGLAAALTTFESFHDGVAGVLVDTLGRTFLNVKLESFQPKGKIFVGANGNVYQSYEARFVHMSAF